MEGWVLWVVFWVCFFKSISAPRPSFPEGSATFRGTRTALEWIFCALVPGRHGLNASLSALGGAWDALSRWVLEHAALLRGQKAPFTWSSAKTPRNPPDSFIKRGAKKMRAESSLSCDTALAVRGERNAHHLFILTIWFLKEVADFFLNVLVWGLTLPARTCRSFAHKPCSTSKLT